MTEAHETDVARRLEECGLYVDQQDAAAITERWREQLAINKRLRRISIPHEFYGLGPKVEL